MGTNGETEAAERVPAMQRTTENPARAGLSEERMKGLEPSTFCMASRRSSQLSYIRVPPSLAVSRAVRAHPIDAPTAGANNRTMRTFGRIGVTLAAACVLVSTACPATAATGHRFTAAYTGHGSGQASGSTASGSATAAGSGNLIGAGTLTGSGSGTFTSPSCVAFSGTATLKGPHGTVTLHARRGSACAEAADASSVSFSGSAAVTGGTGTFAGARGVLSFVGSFTSQSGSVRVSFSGRLRY